MSSVAVAVTMIVVGWGCGEPGGEGARTGWDGGRTDPDGGLADVGPADGVGSDVDASGPAATVCGGGLPGIDPSSGGLTIPWRLGARYLIDWNRDGYPDVYGHRITGVASPPGDDAVALNDGLGGFSVLEYLPLYERFVCDSATHTGPLCSMTGPEDPPPCPPCTGATCPLECLSLREVDVDGIERVGAYERSPGSPIPFVPFFASHAGEAEFYGTFASVVYRHESGEYRIAPIVRVSNEVRSDFQITCAEAGDTTTICSDSPLFFMDTTFFVERSGTDLVVRRGVLPGLAETAEEEIRAVPDVSGDGVVEFALSRSGLRWEQLVAHEGRAIPVDRGSGFIDFHWGGFAHDVDRDGELDLVRVGSIMLNRGPIGDAWSFSSALTDTGILGVTHIDADCIEDYFGFQRTDGGYRSFVVFAIADPRTGLPGKFIRPGGAPGVDRSGLAMIVVEDLDADGDNDLVNGSTVFLNLREGGTDGS